MTILRGFEKKYLRGLAHDLKPVVLIGKEGLTDAIVRAADEALSRRELLKIKFNDFKEKSHKETIVGELADRTGSSQAGMIGHTAILYRQNSDPEKRHIKLPKK